VLSSMTSAISSWASAVNGAASAGGRVRAHRITAMPLPPPRFLTRGP